MHPAQIHGVFLDSVNGFGWNGFNAALGYALDLRTVGPLLRVPMTALTSFEQGWLSGVAVLGLAVGAACAVLAMSMLDTLLAEAIPNVSAPSVLAWRQRIVSHATPICAVEALTMEQWRARVFARTSSSRSA